MSDLVSTAWKASFIQVLRRPDEHGTESCTDGCPHSSTIFAILPIYLRCFAIGDGAGCKESMPD